MSCDWDTERSKRQVSVEVQVIIRDCTGVPIRVWSRRACQIAITTVKRFGTLNSVEYRKVLTAKRHVDFRDSSVGVHLRNRSVSERPRVDDRGYTRGARRCIFRRCTRGQPGCRHLGLAARAGRLDAAGRSGDGRAAGW